MGGSGDGVLEVFSTFQLFRDGGGWVRSHPGTSPTETSSRTSPRWVGSVVRAGPEGPWSSVTRRRLM